MTESLRKIEFYIFQTEQLIFLCLLFLFILVCNVTVLILIFMTRKKRSRMNIFIANLALAGNILPRFSKFIFMGEIHTVFSFVKCFLHNALKREEYCVTLYTGIIIKLHRSYKISLGHFLPKIKESTSIHKISSVV